jgi:hypothetical protein
MDCFKRKVAINNLDPRKVRLQDTNDHIRVPETLASEQLIFIAVIMDHFSDNS